MSRIHSTLEMVFTKTVFSVARATLRCVQNYTFAVALFVLAASFLVCHSEPARAQTMPPGFAVTKMVTIGQPTCFAFAPDGRIFVCSQRGNLLVVKNGAVLPDPFVSLAVDYSFERGLVGIVFDPDFNTNHYLYLFYTTAGPDFRNRISRFTADGDVAVPNSEVVLLEIGNLTTPYHNGGCLRFGPDGKLYIAVGDGGTSDGNSQSLNTVKGKILRINKDGTIPEDNPFYATTTGDNRAIWCYGLRNPYTFAFQPGTGRMFINDVGGGAWEEVNEGAAGANYGWPTTEGPTDDPRFVPPIFAYPHQNGTITGCAITGGSFYNPAVQMFPPQYLGKYFFHDYCTRWIMTMDPDTHVVSPFMSGFTINLIDIKPGPDGAMYFVSRTGFDAVNGLFRISYTPVTLSFQVLLEDSSAAQLEVTCELRPVGGGTTISRTVTLDAEGKAVLSGIPHGEYDFAVKAPQWLRRVTRVNLSQGNVSGVAVTLTGGDANDDNAVDVLDLDLLIQSFDKCQGDTGFLPGADFNRDTCSDVLDLDILLRNFDLAGDA